MYPLLIYKMMFIIGPFSLKSVKSDKRNVQVLIKTFLTSPTTNPHTISPCTSKITIPPPFQRR